MAAVLLFWNTNMAAVTSFENVLLPDILRKLLKLITATRQAL